MLYRNVRFREQSNDSTMTFDGPVYIGMKVGSVEMDMRYDKAGHRLIRHRRPCRWRPLRTIQTSRSSCAVRIKAKLMNGAIV
jgi:hypothetical protein